MFVITLRKGGVGKTTVAMNMAKAGCKNRHQDDG
jgi:cellulose biosynthesis protein BcsQ